MKKVLKLFVICLFSTILFACGSGEQWKKEDIVGIWKAPGSLEAFDYITTFHEDGTYISYEIAGTDTYKQIMRSSKGTYELNGDKINYHPETGTVSSDNVKDLTADTLVLGNNQTQTTAKRITQADLDYIMSLTSPFGG